MRLLFAFLTFISLGSVAQINYEHGVDLNLPPYVLKRFEADKLLAKYEISDKVNPFYLRGDFDGDGIPDYEVLVSNRTTKKIGIAIVRSGATKAEVIGAGGGVELPVGPSASDFAWMDVWTIERKHRLQPNDLDKPVGQMVGEGIDVEKSESASALIYWDGKQYRWFQTSD